MLMQSASYLDLYVRKAWKRKQNLYNMCTHIFELSRILVTLSSYVASSVRIEASWSVERTNNNNKTRWRWTKKKPKNRFKTMEGKRSYAIIVRQTIRRKSLMATLYTKGFNVKNQQFQRISRMIGNKRKIEGIEHLAYIWVEIEMNKALIIINEQLLASTKNTVITYLYFKTYDLTLFFRTEMPSIKLFYPSIPSRKRRQFSY